MRALFKLKALVGYSNRNPTVAIKLFEQLIKPIALYGSEIWGLDCLKVRHRDKFVSSLDMPLCEKLNLSMCRHTLGVHKKSHVNAVRAELGTSALGINI